MAAGRRYFVPIGVSRPGGALRDLPRIDADVARLARVFRGLGYRRVPMPRNPSAATLRDELARWLARTNLGPADDVIIYYSGHGCVVDGTHYLCTAGFDRDELATRAFKAHELIELAVARKNRPGKLWLILDCCQAGAALTESLCRALACFGTSTFVLAASAGWGEAVDGFFARTLARAITAGRSRSSLSLDGITTVINEDRPDHPAIQASLSTACFDLLYPRWPSGAKRAIGAGPRRGCATAWPGADR